MTTKFIVGLRRQPFLQLLRPLNTHTHYSFANTVSHLPLSRAAASTTSSQVTWTDFLAARRKRRLWERIGGITLGAAGFLSGSIYFFFVAEIDPFQPRYFGIIDAGTAYTIAPFMIAGIGGMVGMSIGGILWRANQKSAVLKQIDAREKEFYRRIAANRPKEVRAAGFNNPIPDYYGEQITSVPEYRAWLRKQRKYAAVTSAGGVVGARIPGMNVNLAGKSTTERTPNASQVKNEMGYNRAKKLNIDLSAALRDDRK